jgi:5-methylcytosine-specific restriction endonuclease McrA
MVSDLHKKTVLRLNANYMRLGWATPAEAVTAMMSEGRDGSPPALGLDIHYNYDEYGKPIVDKMVTFQPFEWEYWMMLEPRKGDLDKVIHTAKRIIRVPTVIVCPRFHRMPEKEQRATPSAIRQRDGNRCQYTGVVLTNKTFSLDHVVPKSKGGKDSWHNLVAAHKDVNSAKGNKWNHEAGLKLLKHPVAPKITPLCVLVKGNFHPDHEQFS